MFYPLKITRLGDHEYQLTSRDIPELYFKAETEAELVSYAGTAVPGTLELCYRRQKKAFPLPSSPATGEILVAVPLKVQAKIALWNFILSKGLKLGEAAKALGVSQTVAQRFVDLSQNRASLDAIEDAMIKLGGHFTISVERRPE